VLPSYYHHSLRCDYQRQSALHCASLPVPPPSIRSSPVLPIHPYSNPTHPSTLQSYPSNHTPNPPPWYTSARTPPARRPAPTTVRPFPQTHGSNHPPRVTLTVPEPQAPRPPVRCEPRTFSAAVDYVRYGTVRRNMPSVPTDARHDCTSSAFRGVIVAAPMVKRSEWHVQSRVPSWDSHGKSSCTLWFLSTCASGTCGTNASALNRHQRVTVSNQEQSKALH
jgi:hypothetical protein